MLKNLGYDGAYRDENISVNVLLENPLDYGLEASTLVFSVTLKAKNSGSTPLRLEDFTFYIMDEVCMGDFAHGRCKGCGKNCYPP